MATPPPMPRPRNARPGGYNTPQDWWANISGGLGRNSNALIGLGSALMSAPGSQGFAAAGQGWAAGNQQDLARQKLAEAEAEKNQTIAWLKTNYPQYADLPPAQGWDAAMKDMAAKETGSTAPANVQEWEYFTKLTPDQQSQYLRMKRANPYLNTGTDFVAPDPANPGATLGPAIPIDNFTPAYDTASGTATGKVDVENKSAADSLSSKLPGIKAVVDELKVLANTATYTQTGQLIDNAMREAGMEPTEAAVARTKYIAMVDNQILPLLRDTFGAAFTAKEGDTLRATLGDPNKSPAEKQVILEAFIEQKVRDLEALRTRLPSQGGAVDYKTKYGLE